MGGQLPKARNLRKRSSSYRVANPDRLARRHLRLLRAVARVELQECADEASALAKMYEGVGRVAEKMKKLEDGLVLKVDYGAELLEILSILVVKIVLPYVPVDLRLQCAKEADEVLPMLVHRLKLEAIDGKVN